MADLLIWANEQATAARAAGQASLSGGQLAEIRSWYRGAPEGNYNIQISGTASDLALFLWQRDVTASLDVRGDSSLLSRYFALVPPISAIPG
jgi:hypothetical protein